MKAALFLLLVASATVLVLAFPQPNDPNPEEPQSGPNNGDSTNPGSAGSEIPADENKNPASEETEKVQEVPCEERDKDCPENWISHRNRCYKLSQSNVEKESEDLKKICKKLDKNARPAQLDCHGDGKLIEKVCGSDKIAVPVNDWVRTTAGAAISKAAKIATVNINKKNQKMEFHKFKRNSIICERNILVEKDKLIAEIVKNITKLVDDSKLDQCEDGWEMNGESCYKMYDERSHADDRDEAHAECQKRNAHLIRIESSKEQEFVQEKFVPSFNEEDGVKRFWIDLKARTTVGGKRVFKWSNEGDLDYACWGRAEDQNGGKDGDQPNNAQGIQDCVVIQNDYKAGVAAWNDFYCNTSDIGFICEKPVKHNKLLETFQKDTMESVNKK